MAGRPGSAWSCEACGGQRSPLRPLHRDRVRSRGDQRFELAWYRTPTANPDVLAPGDQPLDLRDYVELIVQGGFPKPVLRLPASERGPWLSSYLEQLLTRDVAELSPRHDPQLLRRFVEAYAISTGGVVDRRTLEQAAGIAKATADRYEQLLGSLLVTFVVAQLRAELPRCDSRPRLCHLRQEQGRREVDVIVEYGAGRLLASRSKPPARQRETTLVT